MAKKTEKTAPVIEESAPQPRDPTQWIGLDHGRTGEYVYVEDAAPYGRDRAISVDGRRYEHCDNDPDGV